MNRFVLSLSIVVAAAFAWPTNAAEREVRFQNMAFAMNGHEVGTVEGHDFETVEGFRFVRESKLSLQRGKTVVKMHTTTVVRTKKDLTPIGYTFVKHDAAGEMRTEGTMHGDSIVLITTQAGTTSTQTIDVKKTFTFATVMERIVRENLRDGAHIKRPVLLEEMGAVVEMTADIKSKGKNFVVTTSFSGLSTIEEMTPDGETVLARTPALGAIAYPVSAPPPDVITSGRIDLLARSTWTAPILPRQGLEKVRYRIYTPGARSFQVPEDDRQRVLRRTDEYLDVEVRNRPATHSPLTKAWREKLTAATPYEATNDANLMQVAQKQTRGLTSTRDKVEKLTHFVYGYVTSKSLDRGYAPAVATLQSRTGDCTEHSVLLSALLRSLGIATRLVDGVVVDGGRSGYHEWVEAQIDDQGFVPTDPTFGQFPASPARLALVSGTSSPEGLLKLGIAAGRILRPAVRIEVLDFIPAK